MAQGVANTVTGFFGGMGGCAMIGQSMINVKSGGRTRLSGISAALFLLAFIVVASPAIEQIPLAALVGVMFMVVIGTFAWNSVMILRKIPLTDALVMMLVTVVTVLDRSGDGRCRGRDRVGAGLCVEQRHADPGPNPMSTPRAPRSIRSRGRCSSGRWKGSASCLTPTGDPIAVIIDFADSRVADQSALTGDRGDRGQIRGGGQDGAAAPPQPRLSQAAEPAGQLIVDSDDDPDYGIAVNYSVKIGQLGAAH